MKQIDRIADRYQGQYVIPKPPFRERDEEMSRIISQMKLASNQTKTK